jgi:hypothetical protein
MVRQARFLAVAAIACAPPDLILSVIQYFVPILCEKSIFIGVIGK